MLKIWGLKVKVWKQFDPRPISNRANRFELGQGWAADFFLRPSSFTASNFEALWSIDLKFLALKDLKFLQKYLKIKRLATTFG